MWLRLAEGEQSLGLNITDEQLDEMRNHLTDINYDVAAVKEKELRHDVMAHVHAFGVQCPSAMPILHLGATSCFIGDNTELIQIRDSMRLVKRKLVQVMSHLRSFADAYKSMPTLGFTHFQPAQLVTIGKRATIWLQDFLIDFESLEHLLENLPFRGVKGTTGTQASFLALFNGDHDKVKALNTYVTQASGFKRAIGVSGQTYTRKIDFQVVSILSQIAQSAYKLGGDIRLLANLKEIEEPFGAKQVGSSAMAYKRNPMRSERMCSLARYVISMTANTAHTACNQWLERTLDDSANRRLSLPEAFLGVDVCLTIASDVINGLHVWPNIVRARVKAELPFMATEVILMAAVQAGGDRQVLHEAIRDHSMAAAKRVKVDGAHNDLLERIAKDDLFASVHGDLDSLLDPMLFIGRSSEQVDEFLSDYVDPVLAANSALLAEVSADQVEV